MASYTHEQQRALRSLDLPADTKVRDRNGYQWRRGGGTGRFWYREFKLQSYAASWRELLKSGPLERWDAENETWSAIEPGGEDR